MSVMRGTTVCSPLRSARRSAFETTSLQRADRQSLADARALVDALIGAGLERDLLDHLADELRDVDSRLRRAVGPRLLLRDRHRVVRASPGNGCESPSRCDP